MEAFHFACLFLSLSAGEIFGYEIQPVDAVLFIDGAPTYMRMTNSTSLENVYACILENSRNVDSVIMATQMRGLILDVGQVEENVHESIRHLSGRTGQSLWKSEEDAKMLKAGLARFLTIDYHDSRTHSEAYLSDKFQRSTDWSHGGRQPRTYSGWREPSPTTPEQAKESLNLPANHNAFVTTAKTNRTSSFMWTSVSPTEGTTTKTYSAVTKHSSPATAAMFKHIPARSSELKPSSKSSSSDKYVKAEKEKARNGSDITRGIPKQPESVSHTFDDTSDRDRGPSSRKTIAAGHAQSRELKSVVRDANAAHSFNHILTKEGDVSDRPSTISSDAGGGKTVMVSAEGEGRAKKRGPQKKPEGEMEKRRSTVDDQIY